jgi:hypothetical protein
LKTVRNVGPKTVAVVDSEADTVIVTVYFAAVFEAALLVTNVQVSADTREDSPMVENKMSIRVLLFII